MLFPIRKRKLRRWTEDQQVAIRCICALASVTALGTTGFLWIEPDWGLWKSLFFTLITITTVGYGDEGLSPQGEVFAAAILLLGIGTATYSLSSLVQLAVSYQSSWKRRMQNQIDQLRDHFIIAGHGRIGQTVADRLQGSNLPFVVVDPDMEQVETALEQGYLAIHGDSAEDEVLVAAGIKHASGIICATNSDAENVFVTLSARELNPGLFIAARAGTEAAANKMRRAGATLVVSPYVSAGHQITDAILSPHDGLKESPPLPSGMQLGTVQVESGAAILGQSIAEIADRFPDAVIVAVESRVGGVVIRPDQHHRVAVGDRLTVGGRAADLNRLRTAGAMAATSAAI